jgi:NAD(P)-dependent dehydrogenase (short-subunit alcohol dehydrogenase family)
MFATNLDGAFYSLQPIVAHMVQRAAAGDAFGRLIATSSMASLFGTARNEHYAASKAAINLLMQSLAVEYARYCVTANAILPGWIDTEMIADLQESEKFMIAAKSRAPLRRFGWPSDFGAIAVYLMSQGSGFHIGDTIMIDGSYSIF